MEQRFHALSDLAGWSDLVRLCARRMLPWITLLAILWACAYGLEVAAVATVPPATGAAANVATSISAVDRVTLLDDAELERQNLPLESPTSSRRRLSVSGPGTMRTLEIVYRDRHGSEFAVQCVTTRDRITTDSLFTEDQTEFERFKNTYCLSPDQ
jgi:hypothetical protein